MSSFQYIYRHEIPTIALLAMPVTIVLYAVDYRLWLESGAVFPMSSLQSVPDGSNVAISFVFNGTG